MNRLRVVIFEPGKPGREDYIPDSLKAMQKVVGGSIETVRLAQDAVIVCNEEGRLLGLPENRMGIRGTFFIVGTDGGPEFVNLSRQAVDLLLGR